MATAKKVMIPQPQYNVVLTLSQHEAEFLRFLMQRVGGDSSHSPRALADSISAALGQAGVSFVEHTVDASVGGGSIYFEKYLE